MDIKEALSQLDTLNDEHWTANGDVRLDAVEKLVGKKVSRQELINVAPHFNRSNVEVPDEPKADEPAQDEASPFEELLSPRDFAASISGLDLDELRDIRDLTDKMLDENLKMISDLQEMGKVLKIHKMLVNKEVNRIAPDVDNQTAIRQHLERQIEERAKRYEQFAQVKQMMRESKIGHIDPRSVIDRAMARKTARGGNRPKR